MGVKPSIIWINGKQPKVGDIARAKDIGRYGKNLYVWDACPDCGTERWIKRVTQGNLCVSCATRISATGERNRRWRGGKGYAHPSGITITVKPDHPFFSMASKGGATKFGVVTWVVFEHRLVMAEYLGRCLDPWEVVHHINGDNRDNRIENLLLLPSQTYHVSYIVLQTRVKNLESRVTHLEAENELLKSFLSEARYGNPVLNTEMNREMCRDYIPPIPADTG